MQDNNELRTDLVAIRDENRTGANTANRIGKALIGLFDYIQSVVSATEVQNGYFICNTGGQSARKDITAAGFVLPSDGGGIKVKMVHANTYVPTFCGESCECDNQCECCNPVVLVINDDTAGAKEIYFNGEPVTDSNTWGDGEVVYLYYDGTCWQAFGGVFQAIEDEKTERRNADTSLQNNIDNETTERRNADTALQNNIIAETERSQARETASVQFDPTSKYVIFKNSAGTVLYQFDASPFIIDGMVEDVVIVDDKLVITFNTDAGQQNIEIPLTEIFDPSNYYNKDTVDELFRSITEIITAIHTKLSEGYIYAGIATPSTNPGTPTGKVFYVARSEGTYTSFGEIVLTHGINVLKYNGLAWSSEQIAGIDGSPMPDSHNFTESGGIFKASTLEIEKMKMTDTFSDGGVRIGSDITVVNPNSTVQSGVYEHLVLDVKQGEQYVIRGKGGTTNLMLWGTTVRSSNPDTEWLKSRVSAANLDTVEEPITITILENETHLIINNQQENTNVSVYKVNLPFQRQIDDMEVKINTLASGVSVALNTNPTVIYKGIDQTVSLTGRMNEGTPSIMELLDGSVVLKTTTSSPITKDVNVNITDNTKKFGVRGTVNGITINNSATLNARYPIYYGFGQSATAVAVDANRYAAATTAVHTYEKTASANGQHFYILVPSDISALSSFTMGGAPFVMSASSETINGITYKVYESGSTYNTGTTVKVTAS